LHKSVKFDFTADLSGTGNRPEEVIKWWGSDHQWRGNFYGKNKSGHARR